MLTPNYRYGDYPRMGAAKMSCGQRSPFKFQKNSLIAKLIHQEQTQTRRFQGEEKALDLRPVE